MIVTEDMLTPYRVDGFARLWSSRKDQGNCLPDRYFAHTETLFWSEWHPDGDAKRQSHTVVPVLAFVDSVPVLNPSYEWMALQHQCGGSSTSQVRMVATRFTPRSEILPHLNMIASEFYFAETGHFHKGNEHVPQIAELISRYHVRLEDLGLDCKVSRDVLQEAIYPIDASQSNMNKLAATPVDMSAVFQGRDTLNPVILLLSSNSD
jgi:hypothetical protein